MFNTRNMTYQNLVDVVLLKSLIDARVDSIYSDGLTVYKDHIETRLLVFRLTNKSWLNFTNQAHETPNDCDYYQLAISRTSIPNIPYNIKSDAIVYPFSKVGFKSTIVESIEIYNRVEKYGDETFDYDVVLLFKCKGKLQFIIALEERVDEWLVYSSNFKIINRYLKGLNLRIIV